VHPSIEAAAVVAMPDDMLGEKACVYLALKDGETFDLALMRSFLTARGVAQFKWPERIELVRQLPLTNVGKVKKSDLRADIAQKIARERASRLDANAERN
jgi:2,3-dihydroxybenzoate-AMP ligase